MTHRKPTEEDWARFFDQRDSPKTAMVALKAYLDDLREQLTRLERRVTKLEEYEHGL